MAVGEFYVEHQNWARFPKVVHVCRKRGYGGIERNRYVPERTCEMFQYRNALGLIDEYQCSECGADIEGKSNYCPSCGAKMVVEE